MYKLIYSTCFFLISILLSGCSTDLNNRLVAASSDGDLEAVQSYLQRGANVNYQQLDTGTTPLIAAARKGHIQVARTLLAAGANINIIDQDVGTALFWAAFEGKKDMVILMLERGAKLNCSTASGTYLMDIIRKRNFNDVERLMNEQFQREKISVSQRKE